MELIAKISFPADQSLVRATVPIFGMAGGTDFKSYRLEFCEGTEPKDWRVIVNNSIPQNTDPWSEGKVRWDPDKGASGNLGNWDTGLYTYRYPGITGSLNGEYTLRLVVEGKSGKTAEAQIVVQVGEVIGREIGGSAASPDHKVVLQVDPESVVNSFHIVSIQPSADVTVGQRLVQIGKIYEFRPPGLEFIRPVHLIMSYTNEDLTATGRAIPPERIGIYEYQPVQDRWKRLPSELKPLDKQLVAEINRATDYIAYFALCADVESPGQPMLNNVPKEVRGKTVILNGEAEIGCKIEFSADGQVRGIGEADADGSFKVEVRLEEGENNLRAYAIDDAGNRSPSPAYLRVARVSKPPKSIGSIRILGPNPVSTGGQLIVRVTGEDSDSANVNYAPVRVSSERSDPSGFQMDLTETDSGSGVFVGVIHVGDRTDAKRQIISGSIQWEKITVESLQESAKRVERAYADRNPPSCPVVVEEGGDVCVESTFEDASRALANWSNVDEKFGAGLSVPRESENGFLRLAQQHTKSHVGVEMAKGFDCREYPVVGFNYRFSAAMEQDLAVQFGDEKWFGIKLNDRTPDLLVIGQAEGFIADGAWHYAEVNLNALALGIPRLCLKFEDRESGDRFPLPTHVKGLRFINLDGDAYLRQDMGSRAGVGAFYDIDNFRVFRFNKSGNVSFRWSAEDANGIGGYSFVLDGVPDTVPPVTEKPSPQTEARFSDLRDGRWYFHVRAVDKCGNWGPANHSMVFVDANAPRATAFSPSGDEAVDFTTPITVTLDDQGGSGIDRRSIGLRLDGADYWMEDPVSSTAFAWDASSGRLTFDPEMLTHKWNPYPLIFADGQTVKVEVIGVEDNAGRPLEGVRSWTYKTKSPLKVDPPDPDGENGWYVTPPKIQYDAAADQKVIFNWEITADEDEYFRKGNSINELRVFVRQAGENGARRIFVRKFKLDVVPPDVRVVSAPDTEPGSTATIVSLEHDDWVIDENGLQVTCYRDGEFGDPIQTFRLVPRLFSAWQYNSCREALSEARSVRMEGLVRFGKIFPLTLALRGLAEGAKASVWIDGDRLMECVGVSAAVKSPPHGQLYSFAGFHKFVMTYQDDPGGGVPTPVEEVRRNKGIKRKPAALYSVVSLATVEYNLDDGPWQLYEGPFKKMRGQVLHVRSRDQAGRHFEKTFEE